MYEGKPPFAPAGQRPDRDSGPVTPLRELTWSDLRARLEAARDLRAGMEREHDHPPASFDAGFASCLAARGNGKEDVNPSDLANGKGSGRNEGIAHDVVPSVSRGNT